MHFYLPISNWIVDSCTKLPCNTETIILFPLCFQNYRWKSVEISCHYRAWRFSHEWHGWVISHRLFVDSVAWCYKCNFESEREEVILKHKNMEHKLLSCVNNSNESVKGMRDFFICEHCEGESFDDIRLLKKYEYDATGVMIVSLPSMMSQA